MKANENHYKQAQDWFYDRYLAREVEAQRYYVLCYVLAGIIVLSLLTLIILLPLKRTVMEPYVVLIDDINGITSTLTAAKSLELSEHIPVMRYFLAKYVQAYESYNTVTATAQFDLVRAFSSPETFMEFKNAWGTEREERTTEILSVTFPEIDVAHVRYILQEQTWLATLKLAQVAEVDDSLAVLNPLGLVVTDYKTIRESSHE